MTGMPDMTQITRTNMTSTLSELWPTSSCHLSAVLRR